MGIGRPHCQKTGCGRLRPSSHFFNNSHVTTSTGQTKAKPSLWPSSQLQLHFMSMCISTKSTKRSTAKKAAMSASMNFSKKPSIVPRSNDLSILVDRALLQRERQSSQQEQVDASKSLKSAKEFCRFDASEKRPETSSPKAASKQSNAILQTSQILLQVRIVLKILEKEDPCLRKRLVQSINRLRKTLPKGRTFNRSVDALMRDMVKPQTYQVATEARTRLASTSRPFHRQTSQDSAQRTDLQPFRRRPDERHGQAQEVSGGHRG